MFKYLIRPDNDPNKISGDKLKHEIDHPYAAGSSREPWKMIGKETPAPIREGEQQTDYRGVTVTEVMAVTKGTRAEEIGGGYKNSGSERQANIHLSGYVTIVLK